MDIAHGIAIFAGGLFAGSTFYVSAVAQPVRMMLGADLALPLFRRSLPRTQRLNSGLHVITLAATILACIHEPAAARIAALILLAPILPLSLVIIRPLNLKLGEPALIAQPDKTMALLEAWGRLHAARTAFGMASFLTLVLGG